MLIRLLLAVFGILIAAGGAANVASEYVEIPGGRLYYETAGAGNAVVLLHDGILHRETWNLQFPALTSGVQLVRYDRRGYGRSTPATALYSNIDDLDAVLKALKIEHATLIGCSAGGGLALEFTIAHPDQVRSLVLVGPVIRGLPYSAHYQTRGGHWDPKMLSAGISTLVNYWSTQDPYYVSARSVSARAAVKDLLTANPQDLHQDTFAKRPAWETLSRLREIHVPTLIVVGENDIPDVHAHAGALQAGIADSERVVLSGAGHLVQMEQPDQFNRLVLDFLARH